MPQAAVKERYDPPTEAVARYLVELEQPAGGWNDLQSVAARARAAAERLREEGTPVRFLRSIFLPEDDACLLLLEAPSGELAGEAARRAELPVGRVTNAVRAGPRPRRAPR